MRTTLLVLAAALAIGAAPSCSTEQKAGGVQSTADVDLVRELETKSWIAWKAQDAAFFERFLSEDHVEVHGYGIAGRTAVVNAIRGRVCIVQSYSLSKFSTAVVAPDAVLVTYRADQETHCGNSKLPSPVWVTSLYVKRSGQWLNVLYQQTPAT